MPTSIQLANAITSMLVVDDLSLVPAKDIQSLLNALNTSLDEYWHTLPNFRKLAVESYVLRAPLKQRIQIVSGARGFTFINPFPLDGYLSANELVGKTCIIHGDSHPNRLQKPDTLLNPYLGTSGEHDATIYSDAASFAQDDLKIVGNPLWRSATESDRALDYMDDVERQQRCHTPQFDVPTRFWTEPMLAPQRNENPIWLLRVWPIPVVTGSLQCEMMQQMPALAFDDFQVARQLPIYDRDFAHVCNICQEALLASPLVRPDVEKAAIRTNAERSRQTLQFRQPTRTNTAAPKVHTPLHW